MTAAFAAFNELVRTLAPKTAIVLGSGLADATTAFHEFGSVAFGDVPGLVPTTVSGHHGRIAVGLWDHTPTLVFFGRLHFYEGHAQDAIARPVRVAGELGAKVLLLTNAAGGINPALKPGSLMAIRGHLKLVGRGAWRLLAVGTELATPYSPRLLQAMQKHGSEVGHSLPIGIYAALTGPNYETPAEIRALAACGADAVGMSTALEAEAAAEMGLEVAAISCITNAAAGLSIGPLNHLEVLNNAKLVVGRLGYLLGRLVTGATES